MRKILSIFAMASFMIGMIACDKIEEDNYFKANNESTDIIPLPKEDIDNWKNEKVLLLEDFTGVKCTNCPDAAMEAHKLKEQYKHQLVILSVHASEQNFFSNPLGGYPDFRTEEATEWYNTFKPGPNPIGTINRQNGPKGYRYQEWAGIIAQSIDGTPNIRLLSATEYNENDKELKVSVYSKFLEDFPDKYNLTVCLMEDHIIGKQAGANGGDEYDHRHVFRKTLNGAWGTELNEEIIPAEEEIVKNYSIKLDNNFNADNCYIISYIYDRDTKEILQVTEKKIK